MTLTQRAFAFVAATSVCLPQFAAALVLDPRPCNVNCTTTSPAVQDAILGIFGGALAFGAAAATGVYFWSKCRSANTDAVNAAQAAQAERSSAYSAV